MSFNGNEVNLTLQLQSASDDFDADDLDQLTRSLMRSLEDVGVESVEVMREQNIPAGAKGDLAILGQLLVAVVPPTLPKVVEFLLAWTSRNKDQPVKMEVTREAPSGEKRTVTLEYPASLSSKKLKTSAEVIQQLLG